MLFAATASSAATYEIKEIQTLDNYRQHFAMGLNDNGTVLGVVRDRFNYPIYMDSYLFSNSELATCSYSAEEVTNLELDAVSLYCVKARLATNSSLTASARVQKVGDVKTFIHKNDTSELTILTDYADSELDNLYTHSNFEQLVAINNNDIAVGFASAPYYKEAFQQTGDNAEADPIDFFKRDYKNRGVIQYNGTTTLLEPQYTTYGGLSVASDITDSGLVAGYMSIDLADGVQDDLDDTDKYNTDLAPIEIWAWTKQNSSSIFKMRPAIWQLDDAGNVVSTQTYELAFTPSDEQTGNYSANALAINESGVAVGYSSYPISSGSTTVTVLPSLFSEGTSNVFVDPSVYDGGYAFDINDDGIVVGRVYNVISINETLNRFFVYNSDTDEFTVPTGFYSTSDSSANAINNNGLVVGEAEYEITTESTRRKHGFLYNVNTQEFQDLNDLVECNSDYEIVEVKDINDNNEIVATALKLVDRKDALGELVTDDDGEVLQEQIAVAVKLTPIAGGSIDDCTEVENPGYERKGFSTGLLSLLLIPLVYIRRKFI